MVVQDGARTIVGVAPEHVLVASGEDAFRALDQASRGGFWSGFIAYDLGRAVEHVVARTSENVDGGRQVPDLPDIALARYDARLVLEADAPPRVEGDGATAELLAEDLRRFQAAEPISARPIGSLERAARWCMRNRTVALLLLTVMVVLIAGATTATIYGVRANELAGKLQNSLTDTEKARGVATTAATDLQKELTRSGERLRLAEVRLYSGQLRNAQDAIKAQNINLATEYLNQCQWSFRGWEWRHLKDVCEGLVANPVRAASRNLHLNNAKFVAMAYSADQSRIISGSENGEIIVWKLADREIANRFPTHPEGIVNFIQHDRTHTIATAGRDSTIKGWDLRTGRELFTLSGFRNPVLSMVFTSDGKSLGCLARANPRA